MRAVLIGLLVLLLGPAAVASTWSVEKDGTGDYTVIQDAVNAAASGDTILIGPGRFDEMTITENPNVDWYVCVDLPGIDITLIGSGMERTIIGPEVPGDMTNTGWRGIVNWPQAGDLVIEGMTIENLVGGVDAPTETLMMRQCRLRGCMGHEGVLTYALTSTVIEECLFEDNENGIVIEPPCGAVEIRDSEFSGHDNFGIYILMAQNVFITDVAMTGSTIYSQGGGAVLQGVRIIDGYMHCMMLWGGECEIYDCIMSGSGHAWCIFAEGVDSITGSGNILKGASMAAIRLNQSYASITDSHILSDADYIDCVNFTTSPIVELDFRNNYWGTSDAEEISARIQDGYDDPSEYVHVLFEPFSPVPLPDEKKSLGDVKRMFR